MTAHAKPQNLVKGATGDWEIIVGLEIHAQVTSRSKLFSGASTSFGGEPNAHVSLVDAAMPGMLPVIKRRMRRAGRAHRSRAEGPDQSSLGLRPQELFLPRSATGLPDLAVQEPDRWRGNRHRRSHTDGDLRRGDRAAAPRTGCGEVAARSVGDGLLRRSQPVGRRADGDRVEAGHALRGRGQGLRVEAAHHSCAISAHATATWSRGLCAPTSTSVCAGPASPLARVARSRTSIRSASSDRRSISKRGARSTFSRTVARSRRKRGSMIRAAARRGPCATRKKRMITAISPTPICCRWSSTRPMSMISR